MPQNKNFATGEITLHPQSSKTKSQSRQLELSTSDPIVLRVPPNLALGDDRFYVCIDGWCAGVQLSRTQAYRALELIGTDRESATIYRAIELVIDGGVK